MRIKMSEVMGIQPLKKGVISKEPRLTFPHISSKIPQWNPSILIPYGYTLISFDLTLVSYKLEGAGSAR